VYLQFDILTLFFAEAYVSSQVCRFFLSLIICLFPLTLHSTAILIPYDQPTIQAGIDAALDGDTVLVRYGTYSGDGNTNISFNGKNIVVMANPYSTTIVGDNTQPCFKFLNGESSSAILEGFTISNFKQAIVCKNGSSPTIKRCFLENNEADSGGGLYSENSSPLIENCRFISNTGGGIYSKSSNPTISGCIFEENHAEFGGAVFSDSLSAVTIIDCEFTGNYALAGGAVASREYATLNITSSNFRENYIDLSNVTYNAGGAIGAWYASTISLTNCTIKKNTVYKDGYGAGIYLYNSIGNIEGCVIDSNTSSSATLGAIGAGMLIVNSEATISNCSIKYNRANISGGVVIWHATTEFYNCEFVDNKSITTCGAVYAQENPTTSLFKNCTFSGNYSDQSAGTMNLYESNINIENCIITNSPSGEPVIINGIGEAPPEFGDGVISESRLELFESSSEIPFPSSMSGRSSNVNISCTDIIGNSDGDWVGDIIEFADINGNFSAYPIFCNPYGNDYGIYTISPCAPENNSCGKLIGAKEPGCENNSILHVETYGDDFSGDGTEGNPFATIQQGIDVSIHGDLVLVGDGTYTGDGNRDILLNKYITVSSKNGPDFTIVDCQGSESEQHRGFYVKRQTSYYPKIIGLTIKNGYTDDYGGGIYCTGPNVRLFNNIIVDNSASLGGGVYCIGGDPEIINNSILRNHAYQGGGIFGSTCNNLKVENNLISENLAESIGGGNGGGLIFASSSGRIHKNIISNNQALSIGSSNDQGGGISLSGDEIDISYNIITGNTADFGSALVCHNYWYEPVTFYNNTISGNINNDDYRGIIHSGKLGIDFFNNLVAYNKGVAFISEENQPTISCSNIYNNTGGDWVGEIADQAGVNGNLSINPLLCDTANGDYHISQYSLCAPEKNSCGELIGALKTNCAIEYPCGDMNNDEEININDIIYLIEYYFIGGPAPFMQITGDVNCDGQSGIADIVFLNSYLFNNGSLKCCQ